MQRPKVITLKGVAKAAKLSPTAVSRYLDRDMFLPPESAARIEEAIRQLDYQPNRLARNLSVGSSRLIGLFIPEISNPFFADLASAVEDVAFNADYGVLLCNTQNDPARELSYLRLLHTRQLDGIVYRTVSCGRRPANKPNTNHGTSSPGYLITDIFVLPTFRVA